MKKIMLMMGFGLFMSFQVNSENSNEDLNLNDASENYYALPADGICSGNLYDPDCGYVSYPYNYGYYGYGYPYYGDYGYYGRSGRGYYRHHHHRHHKGHHYKGHRGGGGHHKGGRR